VVPPCRSEQCCRRFGDTTTLKIEAACTSESQAVHATTIQELILRQLLSSVNAGLNCLPLHRRSNYTFRSQWSLYVPLLWQQRFSIFLYSVFMCFSDRKAIISLNNINRLVFVMETQCVFFAVETEFLYVVYTSFRLQRFENGTAQHIYKTIHEVHRTAKYTKLHNRKRRRRCWHCRTLRAVWAAFTLTLHGTRSRKSRGILQSGCK
jgi:hypothetical protein